MRKTLLMVGICAAGCASYPAPTDQVAKSIAAIRGAQEAGAAKVPAAALQLELAQEQIAEAQKLMANEENRRADDKARRAGQDAELAVALAHAEGTKSKLEGFQSGAGGEVPSAMPAESPR
jgi:hypothetical protein